MTRPQYLNFFPLSVGLKKARNALIYNAHGSDRPHQFVKPRHVRAWRKVLVLVCLISKAYTANGCILLVAAIFWYLLYL